MSLLSSGSSDSGFCTYRELSGSNRAL
jgi:hypothetical protein